jgi:excisionase family DNA binding protein
MTTTPSSRLPRLLDVTAVAKHLGVSTKTVRRRIEGGELHVHRVGRQLRISEEDLVIFLNRDRR